MAILDGPDNANAGERRLDFGDVDDRLGKGLWGFLRQVVPHAARDEPMLIFTREFAAISRGFRMGRAIGVAFEGDGGRGDDRTFGEPLFQRVCLTFRAESASGEATFGLVAVRRLRDRTSRA